MIIVIIIGELCCFKLLLPPLLFVKIEISLIRWHVLVVSFLHLWPLLVTAMITMTIETAVKWHFVNLAPSWPPALPSQPPNLLPITHLPRGWHGIHCTPNWHVIFCRHLTCFAGLTFKKCVPGQFIRNVWLLL